jgi:hypothetical protein
MIDALAAGQTRKDDRDRAVAHLQNAGSSLAS